MQKEHCEKNNFITTAPVILDKISCYQQFTKNKFAFSQTGLVSTISKKKTFTFREKITKPAITEQQQMLLKSKKKQTHTHYWILKLKILHPHNPHQEFNNFKLLNSVTAAFHSY